MCRTEDKGCSVEARDDESLDEDTKVGFVEAAFHLSDSAKVEIACFGDGRDVLSHV